jgi:hypothetical protein
VPQPQWDEPAKQALEALALVLSSAHRPDADEWDVLVAASQRAKDSGCSDPLVLFANLRGTLNFHRRPEELTATYMEISRRLRESAYDPMIQCLATFQVAGMRARDRTDPRVSRRDGRRLVTAAMERLPAALAQPDVPRDAVLLLYDTIGDASSIVERDRAVTLDLALPLLEQASTDAGLIATVKSHYRMSYAFEGRRGMAAPLPPEVQEVVNARLSEAAAFAEEAWRIDPTNSVAAETMMHISAGAAPPKMQDVALWFDRAVAADPNSLSAYATRLKYLEPTWQGSKRAMIEFGRQCLASGKWESGVSLLVVDAHLRVACFDDANVEQNEIQRSYFVDNSEAWSDIKAACEQHLSRYPESLYHRGRYAQLACWAGQWNTANEQFQLMTGEQFSIAWFRTRDAFLRQRNEALAHKTE